MSQQNSTLYIHKDSALHKQHPFTKLSYILFSVVLVYGTWYPFVVSWALVLLNFSLAAWCGFFRSEFSFLAKTMIPLSLFMLPIHGTLFPENSTVVFSYWHITIYSEGMLFSLEKISQLAAVLSSSLIFVFSTHPADLINSIEQAGVPSSLAYLLGSPLLLLPHMRERVRSIQTAQRARGLDTQGSFGKRITSISSLVAPLVLSAIMEIEQRATALELRGFGSTRNKTYWRSTPDSKAQRVFRRILVAVSILLPLWHILS